MACRLQRAVSEGGVPRRGRTERAKTKRSSVDNQMNQWESQEVRQSNTAPLCKWYMEHLGVTLIEVFAMKETLNQIFDTKEVNTGRQKEYDILRGILMVFIFFIHAYQATLSERDGLYHLIYCLGTMTGAALFIFVMGFGTAYSKRKEPGVLAKSGLRMLLYQYANNIAYVAALLIPYPFVCAHLSEAEHDLFSIMLKVYIQYVNIFFLAGVIYLVFALLQKIRAGTAVYLALGILTALVGTLFYGKAPDIPVVGYLLTLLIGGARHVSFTVLAFLSYALLGVVYGRLLRHVRDKAQFYKLLLPICIAVMAAWWAYLLIRFAGNWTELFSYISQTYVSPGPFRVAASIAHILFLAALLYLFRCGEQKGRVVKQLLFYSTNISQYYAIHPLPYFIILGVHNYEGFQPWQCWLMTLLSMVVTEAAVRIYHLLLKRKSAA